MKKLFLAIVGFLFLATFWVIGCGGGGSSYLPPPNAPAGISALGFNQQITVEWTAVDGVTKYNLYWSETPGVTKANGTKIENVTSPYDHMGLTNGKTYYYIVTAVKNGESAESDEASAIPAVLLPDDYATIQAFIDDAGAGPAMRIKSANHSEGGQILVHRSVLVFSAGATKSTISPALDLVQTNNVAGAWFLVNAGIEFHLANVIADGNGAKMFQGIRNHGLTILDQVDFRNIVTTVSPYYGVAVLNFGGTIPGGAGSDTHKTGGAASNLIVNNCTFQNIGRTGVVTKGTGAISNIIENSYTGKGVGNFLDYAFEVGAGGSATIKLNSVSANRGVATSDGSTSAGMLVTDYYGTGSNAVINENNISNSTEGLAIGYSATDASVVVAHYNKFSGNDTDIFSTNPLVDATNNWWGDASGPTHPSNPSGTGGVVSDNVNFTPWCTSEAGCTP